ncbi:CLUMA_CG014213, isoform A [Clunio marinus]|uniref:CLUMA_CG014213, isoform A n=1 Tax=Clunio marinus TaxID=568069 RepID=A0A1J1ILY4_9DIPT|nr:CLUMA_CG014213, isoform A [Clunio marinus]
MDMNKITFEQSMKLLEWSQSSENVEESLKKFETELETSRVLNYLKAFKCHFSDEPLSWKYSCYLFYLLLNSMEDMVLHTSDSPDEMSNLSMNQINAIVDAIQKCTENSLEVCVKKHQNRISYDVKNQSDDEYIRLTSCLRMFRKFLTIHFINSNSLFDDTKLDYLIGILSVISLSRHKDDVIEFQELYAQSTKDFSENLIFKFLMMIKGFNGFSKDFQLLVHRELFKLIRSPVGFFVLSQNLLVKPNDSQVPVWQKWSMVSKIFVAAIKNIDASLSDEMIRDVFQRLDSSLKANESNLAGACVCVLKSLESKDEFKALIHSSILSPLAELAHPDNQINGSITLNADELEAVIKTLHILFTSSATASLPTIIISKYLRLLFNLYTIIMIDQHPEHEKLGNVIVSFLSNRNSTELKIAIQRLRFHDDSDVKLFPRIIYNTETKCLQMGDDQGYLRDDTEAFLQLLRSSNNNLLIFDVFLCLINILGEVQHSGDNFLVEYNVSEENLPEVLHRKFFKKLTIIEPLQEMIQWKSLHTQLREKAKEVFDVIRNVLTKSLEKKDVDEELTIVFFSLLKELTFMMNDEVEQENIKKEIKKIISKCQNLQLKEKIESMMVNVVNEATTSMDPSKLEFEDAMKLFRSSEIHCIVYGSDTLVKLLRRRNPQALSNRHLILAAALHNLKQSESYAYLNVIRLFVTLSYVMDSEVVEALITEYKNKERETDERLKTGEVLLKVTEALGEMSVKYKSLLINCFLAGSRDTNNEIRLSSLANLGTVCKNLSYQISTFFHDMMTQLQILIKDDEYLPSKRAATMVLSDILRGLPNLLDFQEFLLPIYQLLKSIVENENDPQTKLHAQIGLEHLNSKTKEFLNPKLNVSKEIKINLDENELKMKDIKFK